MKPILWGSLVLISVFGGCGKKEEQKPAANTNYGSGNPLTAPVDYLGAVNQAQKAAVRQVDLAGLKSAIQLFNASEGRYPQNLRELVTKRYIPQLPEPPAGSRFDYNPQTGDVKFVRQ